MRMSQDTSERPVRIADIKSGMRALTVVGKILSISEIRDVSTKFGPATVATARLQDESGEIRLNLWRGQISLVKPGDIVRLENAFVRVFNNQNELNLGKDGRIITLSR
jgi:ssDNA-binding replication factor A large subunit